MGTQYERIKIIGSGGFGEVWRVVRSTDNTHLAMKCLEDIDEESVKRFQREVRCLQKLSHPNVISIIGKRLNEAPYFYVMPLASRSLYDELPSIVGNHLRIKQIFSAVLSALQFTHAEGIIHRDLKPENVLIMPDGSIVVADFGLGRLLSSQSTRLTRTGNAMGTLFYCAPEQLIDAKAADARSDIFSLGQVLHDLYVGISTIQDFDSIPYPIAAIIRRATKRDPEKRYQTVQALAEAFTLAIETLTGESDLASLDSLIDELNENPEVNGRFRQLQTGLAGCADNGDVIHSALMKIEPDLFRLLVKTDSPLARRIAETYVTFVTSQSWGFSYTDEIGAKAYSLFNAIEDPEIRIALVRATLIVGTEHNRWDVMRSFGKMLEQVINNQEAAMLAQTLERYEVALDHVKNYVDPSKLRSPLRGLFGTAPA